MVTLPDFMTRARRELMLSTPDFFFCRAQESTGTLEATAVAGGHWAAHKRCEQVDRVAGGAGGARTMVGAANYGRGTHLALASVAHVARDARPPREEGENAPTSLGKMISQRTKHQRTTPDPRQCAARPFRCFCPVSSAL